MGAFLRVSQRIRLRSVVCRDSLMRIHRRCTMAFIQIGIPQFSSRQDLEACNSIQDHDSKAFSQERRQGRAYEDSMPGMLSNARRIASRPASWILTTINYAYDNGKAIRHRQHHAWCLLKKDVSRHRHSPLIALTEEDPTRGELPIKEFSLQNRTIS